VLVRHGADARLALAAVLEMPAEVAQVKDRSKASGMLSPTLAPG
jgi:hypothetical protein